MMIQSPFIQNLCTRSWATRWCAGHGGHGVQPGAHSPFLLSPLPRIPPHPSSEKIFGFKNPRVDVSCYAILQLFDVPLCPLLIFELVWMRGFLVPPSCADLPYLWFPADILFFPA